MLHLTAYFFQVVTVTGYQIINALSSMVRYSILVSQNLGENKYVNR
jgi:hypothetical protein